MRLSMTLKKSRDIALLDYFPPVTLVNEKCLMISVLIKILGLFSSLIMKMIGIMFCAMVRILCIGVLILKIIQSYFNLMRRRRGIEEIPDLD